MKIKQLTEDILPEVEMYYIKDYRDRKAYEGHYLHQNIEVDKKEMKWPFHKGDYVIFTDQPAVRYIMETLEPQAPDSYFAWNFFDGILGQKEGFSAYVFEDMAAAFLQENPAIKKELEEKKNTDPDFAKDKWAQLRLVYSKTPHYEKTFNLYPIGRVIGDGKLPTE